MSVHEQAAAVGFTDSLVCVQVRPNDRDVQGHVNNAVAVEYFEIGRWAWFARLGLAPDRSVAPVVARLEIDYLAQITHTQVDVSTRLVTPDNANVNLDRTFRTVFRQQIHVAGLSRPAARALVTMAFVDQRQNGKLVPLREFLDRASSLRED